MNRRMLRHRVRWLRWSPTVDRYGDEVADWDTSEERCVRAWISQRTRTEVPVSTPGGQTAGGRDGTEDEWVIYTGPDVRPSPRDRFVWDDRTFEVWGEPHPCWRPGALDHYEATLRRVEG